MIPGLEAEAPVGQEEPALSSEVQLGVAGVVVAGTEGPSAAVVVEGSLAVVAEGMAFCHPLACILLVQGS